MASHNGGRTIVGNPLNIVLLGPPGSGKSSQARLSSIQYKIPHIDTGQLLRTIAEEPSELGQRVKQILAQGLLVPEEIVAEAIERRLTKPDTRSGFVLDGYPRTLTQAELFDRLMKRLGRKLTASVFIDVPEEVVLDRLSKRLVCSNCGAVFQSDRIADQRSCPLCNGKLERRPDDRPETVLRRLKLYAAETEPLIAKFRSEGILVSVDGTGEVDEVFKRIKDEIERRLKKN